MADKKLPSTEYSSQIDRLRCYYYTNIDFFLLQVALPGTEKVRYTTVKYARYASVERRAWRERKMRAMGLKIVRVREFHASALFHRARTSGIH